MEGHLLKSQDHRLMSRGMVVEMMQPIPQVRPMGKALLSSRRALQIFSKLMTLWEREILPTIWMSQVRLFFFQQKGKMFKRRKKLSPSRRMQLSRVAKVLLVETSTFCFRRALKKWTPAREHWSLSAVGECKTTTPPNHPTQVEKKMMARKSPHQQL